LSHLTPNHDANGNQTAHTIDGVPYAMTFAYAADGSHTVGTVDGVTTAYIGGIHEWQASTPTAAPADRLQRHP
jgi:hypothetical protein